MNGFVKITRYWKVTNIYNGNVITTGTCVFECMCFIKLILKVSILIFKKCQNGKI